MFASLKQLFLGFTAFFIAFEKIGKATVSLTEWAEESAAEFADQARSDRAKKRIQQESELKLLKSSVK